MAGNHWIPLFKNHEMYSKWSVDGYPSIRVLGLPVGGFRKSCALSVGVFVHAWCESLWFQAVSGGELIGVLAKHQAPWLLGICTIWT